jgi:hypothetical protein
MWRKILFAALLVGASTAAGDEAKPWVKVKPDVLPAGAVIPKITFEVKMPVDAPPGSAVEIEIPFHFGLPQTDDPAGDNYLSGQSPRKAELGFSSEITSARGYAIRAVVKRGFLKRGAKFKLFLARERVHPFNQDEKAFLTQVKGPPDESGKRPVIVEGRATVVRIPGGPPAQFRVVAPTCVTPGEPFAVKVAVLDENNNPAGQRWKGDVSFAGEGVTGPATAAIKKKYNNYLEVEGFTAAAPGVYRVEVRDRGLAGRSNPVVCRESWEHRIYWCDEQGHSAFSDGMRQPDEYFDYGRYVGLLDATLLTDHAENLYGDEWPTYVAIANAKNDPPAFVTLVAYEWTSDAWSGGYGHRCVFFRGDGGAYYNSYDAGSDTPAELWSKYRPGEVVMIPHHTLAGFRWSNINPAYERCVEIVSHWGSSEYEGNPLWTRRIWRGGGAVDALNSYYLLGFVGGGDNHNGAPGQNHGPSRMRHMPYYGGITACLIKENTRAAVFDALYNRHVYATAGNRDFVDFTVDGAGMAEIIPVKSQPLVEGEVATEGVIKTLEVVRGGETVYAVPDAPGRDHVAFSWRDETYDGAPTYYYLRVMSEDDHVAFATPVWVAGGTWLEVDPAQGRELAAGARLPLPAPANADVGNYAVDVKAVGAGPGELKIVAGDETVATTETAAGEQSITVDFKAPAEKWNVGLEYDGSTPLTVNEVCLYAYPWLEPKWVGRWWTFEAEDTEKTFKGSMVDDTFASGGRALRVSPADNLYKETVLWGPYEKFEPGLYRAYFYLRAEGDPGSSKAAAEISVATAPAGTWQPPEPTTAKRLSVSSLAGGQGYEKYALDFELLEPSICEFKVRYVGNAILYIDKVEAQQVSYE